jgi:hypothetical protein
MGGTVEAAVGAGDPSTASLNRNRSPFQPFNRCAPFQSLSGILKLAELLPWAVSLSSRSENELVRKCSITNRSLNSSVDPVEV